MGRQLIKYTFGAVVVYLVVAFGTNFGSDVTAAAGGYATDVAALEGRGSGGGAPARRKR